MSPVSAKIKQWEEEVRELARILAATPIAIFVVDSHGNIIHWNRACELLTGIPAADMIGTDKHKEAFYNGRRQLMADLILKSAGKDELAKHYGNKYRRSRLVIEGYEGEDFFPKLEENGKWLYFTAAPLKDATGKILGAIETIQDVTARRLAEQDLRSSEARYRQLFESANDAIFLMEEGLIVDCNRKALALFACSRKEMIGLSPLALSPEAQPNGGTSKAEFHRHKTLVSQDVPLILEWRFLRKDGPQFDAEVSMTHRFKIAGSSHSLAIVRDITGRKKMIQTLTDRKRKLDEKTSYLEKVNQALKASLDHREVEKRAVEENMFVNLKRFVFPYMEELDKCRISSDARAYLNIIDTNLKEMVSRFSRTIFSKYIDFTPAEVRIADFIRDGKNSKEIAHLLGLSPSSVQWHRKNIRQKLGLTNKKINLYTYLNSLAE